MKDIQIYSTLSCPHCQHQATEEMPTGYCQYFWDCPHCHKQLKPKEGDCCVYCSYGSVKCPPILERVNAVNSAYLKKYLQIFTR